jgi:hypothetical protein
MEEDNCYVEQVVVCFYEPNELGNLGKFVGRQQYLIVDMADRELELLRTQIDWYIRLRKCKDVVGFSIENVLWWRFFWLAVESVLLLAVRAPDDLRLFEVFAFVFVLLQAVVLFASVRFETKFLQLSFLVFAVMSFVMSGILVAGGRLEDGFCEWKVLAWLSMTIEVAFWLRFLFNLVINYRTVS